MYEKELIEINDEDRYEIQLLEHVEDWNISEAADDEDCGWFNTLGEALEAFKKNCSKLITNKISTSNLNESIGYNFSDNLEDDLDISDWSTGFVLRLECDGDTLISLHFDYDYKTRLIYNCSIIEFNKDELTAFDLSDIFSILKLQYN